VYELWLPQHPVAEQQGGTRYQLSKVDATGFMVNGSAVTLLPTVTCLGVIVDQEMLFMIFQKVNTNSN